MQEEIFAEEIFAEFNFAVLGVNSEIKFRQTRKILISENIRTKLASLRTIIALNPEIKFCKIFIFEAPNREIKFRKNFFQQKFLPLRYWIVLTVLGCMVFVLKVMKVTSFDSTSIFMVSTVITKGISMEVDKIYAGNVCKNWSLGLKEQIFSGPEDKS